jgi:hypothetical protein
MARCQRLREVLKAELAFLDEGGYRARPRYPSRPNFVFQDSPPQRQELRRAAAFYGVPSD